MSRCFLYFLCTCSLKQVQRKLRVSRGEYPLCSGFPIGASSIPVGTRFSVGKSSVLYLCFRLTLERDKHRHLLCEQIAGDSHVSAAVGQADFVRPRAKSELAQKQIRLTGKGSKGISSLVSPQRQRTNTTTAVPARDCPAPMLQLTLHGSH